MGVRRILKSKHFALSVTCLISAMKTASVNFWFSGASLGMNNKLADPSHCEGGARIS
jgi:hypothetical protein